MGMPSPDELFEANQRLVYWQVGRMTHAPLSRDEAIQAGLIGLWGAARRYNGCGRLATFALPRIRGAILDELRIATGRRHALPVSLDQLAGAGYTVAAPSDAESRIELMLAKDVLATFPPRNQSMIAARLAGYSNRACARRAGVSESRVSQLLRQFRRCLEESSCAAG